MSWSRVPLAGIEMGMAAEFPGHVGMGVDPVGVGAYPGDRVEDSLLPQFGRQCRVNSV